MNNMCGITKCLSHEMVCDCLFNPGDGENVPVGFLNIRTVVVCSSYGFLLRPHFFGFPSQKQYIQFINLKIQYYSKL